MAQPQSTQFGAYVPTTQVWDVAQLQDINVNSPEFKELLVRLYQQLNLMANVINVKESGKYPLLEFVTSKTWFSNPAYTSSTQTKPIERPVLRKVINFGALPNTATKSVAHGITITSNTRFTLIYGASSDPSTSFIPLPYASPVLANNIELNVDATNVNITTGSNRSAYTTTYVILEYIQI